MTAASAKGLSRREFLAATNAAAFLLLLESCSLGSVARKAAGPSIPAGSTPREQALLLLRDAIRASPDHLTQRATDLVAARDATRIVEFVRDRIAVVPPAFAYGDPGVAQCWGPAATLRGGQGTLRERADILADMLTRAGFSAQVSVANLPAGIGLGELYQPRAVKFAPDQSRIDMAKTLLAQSGFLSAPSPQSLAGGPDPVAAILNALPASLQATDLRGDLLPQKVPVVAFDQGGAKRYAFALGKLGVTSTPPAGLGQSFPAEPAPKVTITVSALSSPVPGSSTPRGKLIDIVTGSWTADMVVGRQVLLTFSPVTGPRSILDSGLPALPVRIPTLRVQTDQPPASGSTNLIAAGPMITVQGDVLVPPPGATPASNGGIDGPFGVIPALSVAERQQAIARAASIQAAVNPTAFPEVALDFVVADKSGAPVDGLDAASFSVKEDGSPVNGFAVYSSVRSQPRPRVLIVSDAGSPDQWPSAAVKAAFETGLDGAIVTQAAKTPFDVQFVPTGALPTAAGWNQPQAGTIASALSSAHESADDPWVAVGGPALDQGLVAIVLVSDMNALDTNPLQLPSYQRRLVASRVPVFAAPIGQADAATTTQIVSLSGGARLDPSDPATPAKIVGLIAPLIPKWVGGAYRLRYQTATTGPSQRTVSIGLAGTSLQATETYQVPANPIPPPSFVGLYVTIQSRNLTTFRRLAGVELAQRGGPQGVVDDPSNVQATRAAIDGITTISFETGTPTSAALLEDLVASCLSVEPLWSVWGTGTNDQLLNAAKGGVRRTPIPLACMLQPTRVDPAGVPALKVAILQERVIAGVIEAHADFAIGLNPVIPITTDRHAGFKSVLTTSVGLSRAEALTFPDSAYGRLSAQTLLAIPYGDLNTLSTFLKSLPAEKVDAWTAMYRIYQDFHLLVPQGGAADAFWVVDPRTGAAKAVLLDGTGGATIFEACHFDGFDQLAIALAILSIMCAFAGALYPFFCIGINAASAAMCAAAMFMFPSHADAGTPYGLAMSGISAMSPVLDAFPFFNAGVGFVLLMITLKAGCS